MLYDGILVECNDVCARSDGAKRVEEKLQFTQFSMDHAGEAAFWMGHDAQFIYVNEKACRSLGYGREELLSMTVYDIDPDFPKEIREELPGSGFLKILVYHGGMYVEESDPRLNFRP